MTRGPGVLIVGGGLAGQRCAETLRSRGYDGRIRIACAEPDPPYDRPPLSKGVLAGTKPEMDLAMRPAGWYRDNEVELQLATRATGLDPDRRRVTVADGSQLGYEQLLVSSGAAARHLPVLKGYENVHTLRTLADARRLRAELEPGRRLAVVGAGFIGQEVAATARGLGLDVTMIEALAWPLAPVFGERVGHWLAGVHADHGVRLLLSTRLEGARGDRRVEELELAGGGRVVCDTVVVGVGCAPEVAWLRGTGLERGPLRTDTTGRTAVPGVFAAGDVSAPFEPRFGVHVHSEHWDAAARQGSAVAQAMVGSYPGTPPLPSFWSDQYGLRIQYVGHAERADDVLFEGDPKARDFAAIFVRDGCPVAALAVGRPRAIAKARTRIEQTYWKRGGQMEARAA
jgi:NADPH-dependent 2,4-dienoyl-CoA reductase/sulfur reductase-like enzyme